MLLTVIGKIRNPGIAFVLMALTYSNTFAQKAIKNLGFISFNTGFYSPLDADYKKQYGDFIFINGLGIGVRFIHENVYVYAKTMGFNRTRLPLNTSLNPSYPVSGNTVNAFHLLSNLGFQFNVVNQNSGFTIFYNGGI